MSSSLTTDFLHRFTERIAKREEEMLGKSAASKPAPRPLPDLSTAAAAAATPPHPSNGKHSTVSAGDRSRKQASTSRGNGASSAAPPHAPSLRPAPSARGSKIPSGRSGYAAAHSAKRGPSHPKASSSTAPSSSSSTSEPSSVFAREPPTPEPRFGVPAPAHHPSSAAHEGSSVDSPSSRISAPEDHTVRTLTEARDKAIEQIQNLLVTLQILGEEKAQLKSSYAALEAEKNRLEGEVSRANSQADAAISQVDKIKMSSAQRESAWQAQVQAAEARAQAAEAGKTDALRRLADAERRIAEQSSDSGPMAELKKTNANLETEIEKLQLELAMAQAEVRRHRTRQATSMQGAASAHSSPPGRSPDIRGLDSAISAAKAEGATIDPVAALRAERDSAVKALRVLQFTLDQARTSASSLGLSVEEAGLLGERNALLHYAAKMERSHRDHERQLADVSHDAEVALHLTKLVSRLSAVHSRTLAGAFRTWTKFAAVGQIEALRELEAAPVSTVTEVSEVYAVCGSADRLLTLLNSLQKRGTPPTQEVIELARIMVSNSRGHRTRVLAMARQLQDKEASEESLAASLQEELRTSSEAIEKLQSELGTQTAAAEKAASATRQVTAASAALRRLLDVLGSPAHQQGTRPKGGKPKSARRLSTSSSVPPRSPAATTAADEASTPLSPATTPSLADLAIGSPHSTPASMSRTADELASDATRTAASVLSQLQDAVRTLLPLVGDPSDDVFSSAGSPQGESKGPAGSPTDVASPNQTRRRRKSSTDIAVGSVAHFSTRLQSLCVAAASTVENLKHQVSRLESEAVEYQANIERLDSLLLSANKVSEGTSSTLASAMAEASKEKERAAELANQLRTMEGELERLRESSRSSAASLEEAKARCEALQAKIDSSESLREEFGRQSAVIDELRSAVSKKSSSKLQLRQQLMQLEANVKNLETDLEAANRRIKDLEAELAASPTDELRGTIARLEQSLADSNQALDAANADVAAVKAQLSDAEEAMRAARSEKDAAEKALADNKTGDSSDKSLAELSNSELRQRVSEGKLKAASYEAELSAAHAEAAEHRRAYEQTRQELVTAQQQLKASREAISEMQTMLDFIQTQVASGGVPGGPGPIDAAMADLRSLLAAGDASAGASESEVKALLSGLRSIAGDSASPCLNRLESALTGTSALQNELQESESANYELAGLVKQMQARAQKAEAAAASLTQRLQAQRAETARLEALLDSRG